jgi:Tol biopolymer transport system component
MLALVLLAALVTTQQESSAGALMHGSQSSAGVILGTEHPSNVDDFAPVWSPDGRTIAFTRGNNSGTEIYVINADGTDERQLTKVRNPRKYEFVYTGSPVWSPDGRRIACTSNRTGSFQIYVMSADSSNQRRLTQDKLDDADPAWSPDGSRIAFTSGAYPSGYDRNELYVMDADGTDQGGHSEINVIDADGTHERQLTR